MRKKYSVFSEWFVTSERTAVIDILRSLISNIAVANSIYPTLNEEYIERRLLQNRAIGDCNRLSQELQYAIETLPVDINRYTRISKLIDDEINLLKVWRKSDNRFKKELSNEENEQ